MTNQQIDELLQAFEEYNYDKIFEFLVNEKLKSQILAGGEFAYFDTQICQDLMSQIQEEGYEYFYSKLTYYPTTKELLKGLTDPKKMKGCLDDSKLGLDNFLREDLLINLNDVEYFDNYIRNSGLDKWYIVDLIIRFGNATDDIEFIKFFVFRFKLELKIKLIKATNDIDYIKECIKDDKLGLNGIGREYLINVVNDKEYTKECLFDTTLKLESEQIRRLLLDTQDKDYIRKCLTENKLSLTAADKVIIIAETFGQKYLIDCCEGKELDLPPKERARLILYVEDRDYIKKALFDEKNELSSFIKRELLLNNFASFGGAYDDFIIECVESEKLGLRGIDKVALIKELKDEKYVKDCILNNKLGLSSSDIVDLVISLGEKEIIQCIEMQAVDFSSDDIKRLLEKVHDNDLRKKVITDKRYDFPITLKLQVLLDCSYFEEYLEEFPWLSMFRQSDEEEYSLLDNKIGEHKKINLPESMTIGIEIESEGGMAEYIYDRFTYQKWKAKMDGSLTDGVEIVSPILHATEEESKQIYYVCDTLKNVGQTVSDSCGGHIHIGADYLKSKQAWANFFEIYCNTEKVLYAITNEEGKAPRNGIMKYATPMAPKIQEAIDWGVVNFEDEADLDRFVVGLIEIQANEHYDEDNLPEDAMGSRTYDRYFGMNLCNLDNAKNTIEFRLANGTINPDLWIDNINLMGGIVAVAQELAIIQEIDAPTKEQMINLELFERLKTSISDKEKLKILIELLGLDSKGYEKRFEVNIGLLIGNEDLFERLSPKKPIIVKTKPIITIEEVADVTQDIGALAEIEAGNQLINDSQERRNVSVQR